MKRSLTTLCLLLCLAASAAAQGPSTNAPSTPNANGANANVGINTNVNGNANAGNKNTNPLTLEVQPGQTARIVVGREGGDGVGIDPWWKDAIDLAAKLLTFVTVAVAIFLAGFEVAKNRRERAREQQERADRETKDKDERAERQRKEAAENQRAHEQRGLILQQRAEDLEQRKVELRWKKAQLAKQMLDGLYSDPYAADAMLMLDWNGRVFRIKASRNHPSGEVEKIHWNEMWAAVRIVERHFNDKERFIRDCFDAFFGHMQIIEHYLNIDLIDLADVVYPFDYYLYALDKNAFMFDNFVGAYHSRAASFILRLREFEEKRKAAAQPDAEEEEEASESEEAAAEPCAYFLFDCPPRKERFVLCLEDPQKIAEARAILNDEGERHVHGTLVDSPVFYNEPWRFHVEPSSVNFYDTALDFAEEVNKRVETQLGPMGKAAFPANDIWHVGGARLLAQLPASRFSDESAAKENEERSMLSRMGRLAGGASEI